MSGQPTKQKALLVTEIGKPITLVDDWPIPIPAAGEARDWGLFIKDSLPAIVTNDVVGVVTALGPGVTHYSIGDHIVHQARFKAPWTQGGLQQYAVVEVKQSAKVPDGMSDDEAATVPSNVMAPLLAIFAPDYLGIPAPWTPEFSTFDYAGTTLLILGGGGNCGKFGVELAAIAGIGRIVVVGGEEAQLKSYGATHVLNRHGSPEEVTSKIRDIVGDELLYVYDAANFPPTQHIGINALSTTKKGKVARLLPLGPIDQALVTPKKEGYELIDVHSVSQNKPDVSIPFWERLPRYLEENKVRPTPYVVIKGLTAERVNGVLDAYRADKKVVKTNIHVQD